MSSGKIVTKSEFAKICGVAKSCVSQWIGGGKISGPAIVGTGRFALIDVVVATAQLRNNLDPNQRFGLNGISTKLDGESPAPPPVTPEEPSVPTVQDMIMVEKLAQARAMSQRLLEEERLRRGIYVRSADTKAATSKVAAEMMSVFEGALTNFSESLAAKFGVPARDTLHCLRGEFRQVRERAARHYAELEALEPELIEDTETYENEGQAAR